MTASVREYGAKPFDYERRRSNPGAWFGTSASLRHAAMMLWRELKPALDLWVETAPPVNDDVALALRLRGPFAMLMGMAIENMLKGLIVQQTPRTESATRTVAQHHQLAQLASDAQFKIDTAERELLKRLTTFIYWAGRYPVPPTAAKAQDSRALRSDDYARLVAMSQRLTDRHLKQPES